MTTAQAPFGYQSPNAWHNRWRSQQLGRSIIVGQTFGKFSTIQAGITDAVARGAVSAATRTTVFVGPGIYAEAPTMAAFVDVVSLYGPEQTVIRQANATIITLAANSKLRGFTIDLTTPTAARSMIVDAGVAATACVLEDCIISITTPGGFASRVVLLSAASNLTLLRCRGTVTDGANPGIQVLRNDTAGATVLVEQCDFALNDTAGFVVFSNVAGTWTLRGNYLSGTAGGYSVSLGTVRGFGNTITTTAAHAVTGGAVTEKSGRQTYVVFAGMIIQHAITAAAADTPAPAATAPYTVVLHPGSYTEAITPATFVNIVGVDRDSVVILQADADVVTIGAITTTLANVTIRLVTPLAARNLVAVSGAAARATLRNIRFEVTTPGGFTNILVSVSAAATVEIQDCFIVDYTGGAAAAAIGISLSAAGTVRVRNTDLTITNANAFAYSVTLAGAVMTLDGCRAAGTATDLRASAGILRVRNTQYRSAPRSATGVIIDESPYPALSALRVVGRLWPLALVANQNIATRLAVGGAATPGGTGQLRLRINDNAADAAGTEQAADAAGALASTWTPARGIRYVLPISVGAFRATTSMFFGVRGALGAAVPGVAEHHAGFIWTGAAFNASSSNGGGVGATTALTTPSTGVHHILEVIVVGGVQVEFYVDGLLVATHAAAAAVPTAVLFFQEYEISTGAGAATTSDITLREGFLEECVA